MVVFNLLIKEGGELGEVVGLPGGLVLPNHLDCELGYLCGFKDSVKENNAQHTAGEVVETVRASCGWAMFEFVIIVFCDSLNQGTKSRELEVDRLLECTTYVLSMYGDSLESKLSAPFLKVF